MFVINWCTLNTTNIFGTKQVLGSLHLRFLSITLEETIYTVQIYSECVVCYMWKSYLCESNTIKVLCSSILDIFFRSFWKYMLKAYLAWSIRVAHSCYFGQLVSGTKDKDNIGLGGKFLGTLEVRMSKFLRLVAVPSFRHFFQEWKASL